MISRHIEVIYCDDIRHEVGGKQSYLGIYSGDLIATTLPLVLPKLGIAVVAITAIEQPFERLEIRIEKDGETILSTGLLPQEVIGAKPDFGSKEDPNRLWALGFSFLLSPLALDKPTKLRVIADTEKGEILGRALRIRLAREDEKIAVPFSNSD